LIFLEYIAFYISLWFLYLNGLEEKGLGEEDICIFYIFVRNKNKLIFTKESSC